MKRVIAIDGPSGAGKSTVAKEVAKALGFMYLDTGALYRAVALFFYKKICSLEAISALTEQDIDRYLKELSLDYRDGRVYLGESDVSEQIREPKIGLVTSVLSARKKVREYLMPIQRNFASLYDTVAEGRDMTTVVFPDAWKKFFLDASPLVRARRRFEQLRKMGKDISFDEALRDVLERDKRDSEREESPLRVSEGVIYIDTSELSSDEVISLILKKVAEEA